MTSVAGQFNPIVGFPVQKQCIYKVFTMYYDSLEFEWDDLKAESNFRKHKVRFSEATTIWLDNFALEIPDPDHSKWEERWIRLGSSKNAQILLVVYHEVIENQCIRIISARQATAQESQEYISRL